MSTNLNFFQRKESSKPEKYNLIIDETSFFPEITHNSSTNKNPNDIHDDLSQNITISLKECYNYFNNEYQTFDENFINPNNKNDNNLKNIILHRNSKEYIPISQRANKDQENLEYNQYVEKNENDEEKSDDKIEKKKENINIRAYSFEYLIQFEKLEMSMETNLLPEETINHINQIEKDLKEMEKNISISNSNYSSCNTSNNSSSTNLILLESWVKKDTSKENKIYEKSKLKHKESSNINNIKKQLSDLLNILTKDNYENIKKQIFEIIKDDVDYQLKFLEMFFPKACMEQENMEQHAKLCKYLNKELSQKDKPKENLKSISSIFRIKLIEKCREVLKGKNFENYFKEKDTVKKEIQLKKFILGNVTFITELMKIKLLSKKKVPECINYLLIIYEKENIQMMKSIDILAILIFFDKFGELICPEEKNLNSKEFKIYKQHTEEIIKKLEKIKNDKDLPRHIRFSIINLIKRIKNSYEKAKIDKFNEEEFKIKEETGNNEDEISQEYINEKMLIDVIQYKNCIDNDGNSNNFPWNATTYLYDIKLKNFGDILEGYIISCKFFIEKGNNIKYAKDYIKELIEYYNQKMSKEEKIELKKKMLYLFDIVKDYAFEEPKIFDIYLYVFDIFIENEILEIKDLENLIKEGELIEGNLFNINIVNKNIYKYIKKDLFKNRIKKFVFIDKDRDLSKWIYSDKLAENRELKNI